MNWKKTVLICLMVFAMCLFCLSGCTRNTHDVSAANTPAAAKVDPIPNKTGKTLIKSFTDQTGDYNTSYIIVSKNGTKIVLDPYSVPSVYQSIELDVITVSHCHPDHKDKDYLESKTCRKILYETGDFTVKEVKIKGIPASHFSGGIIKDAPTNVIYLYEVDGLRIAFMGDMGQDNLIKEQLDLLGRVDIAFTIFTHAPKYGSTAQKCFNLLKQLKPKLVIPTHYMPDIVDKVIKEVGIKEKMELSELAVNKGDLNWDGIKYCKLK